MTCYIINREIHIIIIICFSLFFADEQLGDGLESNLDYSCTLTPLFSIELLSNQSYILQLNFSPPKKNVSLADDSIFSTMSSKPALIKEISLTVIVEDDNFHAALFYLKCLCVPFVLGKNINFLIFFSFLKNSDLCVFFYRCLDYVLHTFVFERSLCVDSRSTFNHLCSCSDIT